MKEMTVRHGIGTQVAWSAGDDASEYSAPLARDAVSILLEAALGHKPQDLESGMYFTIRERQGFEEKRRQKEERRSGVAASRLVGQTPAILQAP